MFCSIVVAKQKLQNMMLRQKKYSAYEPFPIAIISKAEIFKKTEKTNRNGIKDGLSIGSR